MIGVGPKFYSASIPPLGMIYKIKIMDIYTEI